MCLNAQTRSLIGVTQERTRWSFSIRRRWRYLLVRGVESSWSIVARLPQKSGGLGVRGWLTETCESAIACPCAYECLGLVTCC